MRTFNDWIRVLRDSGAGFVSLPCEVLIFARLGKIRIFQGESITLLWVLGATSLIELRESVYNKFLSLLIIVVRTLRQLHLTDMMSQLTVNLFRNRNNLRPREGYFTMRNVIYLAYIFFVINFTQRSSNCYT